MQIGTAKGAKPVLPHLAQSQDQRKTAIALEPCAQLQFQSPADPVLAPTLRLDREAGLFRQRFLSSIKRDKLLGLKDEGGGDMDDVERAAAECGDRRSWLPGRTALR